VEALQLGAADYLVKGTSWKNSATCGEPAELSTLEKENENLRRRLATEGSSADDRAHRRDAPRVEMADRVAATDSTVLILGRAGREKTCCGRNSRAVARNGKAYVAVNARRCRKR